MLFNSLHFLVFFPVVCVLFCLTPRTLRWIPLLAASYYFYGSWKVEYLGLLVFATVVNFGAAAAMVRWREPYQRRVSLVVGVGASLSVLFFYKYFDFAASTVNRGMEALGRDAPFEPLDLLLPIGISFYTFQTLSYTIDVYRGHCKPTSHFGKFALYISFFPQLVAGPIERPQNLLPQILRGTRVTPGGVVAGLRLCLTGFLKKVVVADRLAFYVDEVYSAPGTYSGWPVILATLFFAVQIYCDFSGYTDIARGTARILGFDLMRNFRMPYFSTSIREFWGRWHISLSTWFRDYVYIPLGGSRAGTRIWIRSLLVTFVVSGLWHGAAWTFVLWGAIHGVAVLMEALLGRAGLRFKGVLGWAWTFAVVNVTWVFFRAGSISEAFQLLTAFVPGPGSTGLRVMNVALLDQLLCPVLAVGLFGTEFLFCRERFRTIFERSQSLRFAIYVAGVLILSLLGVFSDPSAFIYFQF